MKAGGLEFNRDAETNRPLLLSLIMYMCVEGTCGYSHLRKLMALGPLEREL